MCCGLHVAGVCCGQQLPMLWRTFSQCCPQHVPHNTFLVLHIMSYTLYCAYVVGVCCGQHYHMLWMTCSRMLSTTYTCSPQHMICCGAHLPFFTMFPTTYTHNIYSRPQHTPTICPWICCGCMLWITTSICCGVHMLWSITTFNDVLVLVIVFVITFMLVFVIVFAPVLIFVLRSCP